jgi:hypothetical protein
MVFPGMKHLLCLLLAGVTATLGRADGQDFEREHDHDREGPRVILYEHANFRGDFLVLYPGDAIENFSGQTFANGSRLNDSVSSIRVEGGAEVYVFEQARFRGAVLRLTDSVRDLSERLLTDGARVSWNDRISSIKVGGARHRDRDIDPDVVIKRAFNDLLGRNPDPEGLRHYHVLILDEGWTESMVRDQIRRSEEYRKDGIDRIIRRAYRDLLGRDPDEDGLRHYRQLMLERDWTDAEVRENLRKSDEYRRRSGGH